MPLTEQEEKILKSIVVASDNDPRHPEFPPGNPQFPATPTYQIEVPGFSNVWLKDESKNPTGTHKDRMAWEIVVTYRDILLAKKDKENNESLPAMSMVSSGSAAIAIQAMLNTYQLPALRVLVDVNIDSKIIDALVEVGCEVFRTDLNYRAYTWRDILKLTNNPNGIDITSNQALDPNTRFYDWLSYEVIDNSPDYCFIPFGTGTLYVNIMNVNKREISAETPDPRFRGNINTLRHCNFMGATTSDPRSLAVKLYSPHLPFVAFDEPWLRMYKTAGFCGPQSEVLVFQEEFLLKAIKILEDQEINCEPSGAAGLALMLQTTGQLPKDKKMLIVNTGKTKY
ncbi:MAG: PLP-dependent lyase/thiolase [Candidatus Andersenbacteria bacterium]